MVITLMTILFQTVNNTLETEPLSYHRNIFFSQIYWQWITPSLVHANWNHWFLNIVNLFATIFIFYEAWSIKKILLLFTLFSLFISLGIHFFVLYINSYVGMSGILYGLTVYGALFTFFKQKLISILILIFITIKLIIPDVVNVFIGLEDILKGLYILTEAHVYGAILGLLFYLFEKIYYRLILWVSRHVKNTK